MLYMNEWDVTYTAQRHAAHPIIGPATQTLVALVDWTNSNSDGWAYWPKPCRAARQLQELISSFDRMEWRSGPDAVTVTAEELRRAYRPLKSFRTRQGADFPIYDPR